MHERSMLLTTLRVVSSFTTSAWLLHEAYESTKSPDEPCPGGINPSLLALIGMYGLFDLTAHFAAPKARRLYSLWQERKKEEERRPLDDLLIAFENLSQEQKQALLVKNYAQRNGDDDIVPLYYCKFIHYQMIKDPVGVKVLIKKDGEDKDDEKIEIVERETMETLINAYNQGSKQDFFRLPGTQTIIATNNLDFIDKNTIIIDTVEIKQAYQDYLTTLQQEIDIFNHVVRIDIRPKIQ